jgi:predicted lipoprotein with Yx(FWY)xxD motif
MRRNLWIGVIIVILILLAIVAYVLYNNNNQSATPSNSPVSSTLSTSPDAINNSVVQTRTNSKVGDYLADPQGNTLYTYAADTTGISNCTGSCLGEWPAYIDKNPTAALPTGFGTIKRSDNGDIQYTYHGLPLYYYVHDSNGQVTGDNIDNFHVAKPIIVTVSPSPVSSSNSPSPSSSPSSSPTATPSSTPSPSSSVSPTPSP